MSNPASKLAPLLMWPAPRLRDRPPPPPNMSRSKTLSEKEISMRRFLMIFALFWVASCTPKIEYRNIVPDVPEPLRQPVTVPERRAETLADVGVILTDHVQALKKANGQIAATDCILDAVEAGQPADVCLELGGYTSKTLENMED
ncbi:hypothetical protein KO491_11500 [Roseovarius nubinhibens]|uniref:hypothetical protein n=1 Tax=Roseovarius nubinhibens TaxID=314263 RepID=UPI001C07F508|nr:hypothetical protein [Roseovarius nubinhibens]MBU3000459.1 hypothetical protein [Roseovarius nubinhibens]